MNTQKNAQKGHNLKDKVNFQAGHTVNKHFWPEYSTLLFQIKSI